MVKGYPVAPLIPTGIAHGAVKESDTLSESDRHSVRLMTAPNRFHSMCLLIMAGAIMLLSACSSASGETTTTAPPDQHQPGVYIGADGEMADISDPTRIVSLNGDITETLFALGVGDHVVGIDLTTTYPSEATDLPDVGLGRRFDVESVISLAPTLVIGDTQVGPPASIDAVRNAGIPVAIIDPTVTLDGVSRKIRTLAEFVDREAEGEALVTKVEAEIAAAETTAASFDESPRVAYLYVRGPETLLMFGNGMPTHFMIEAAGGVDAFGEAGVVFAEPLSAERLVTAAPEVIVTPRQGFDIIGGLDSFLALPGVADTPAGESGRILTFDEAKFLGMGPRSGEALAEFIDALYAETSSS